MLIKKGHDINPPQIWRQMNRLLNWYSYFMFMFTNAHSKIK